MKAYMYSMDGSGFFSITCYQENIFCPLMFTIQYKTPTSALMFLVTCKDFAWAFLKPEIHPFSVYVK